MSRQKILIVDDDAALRGALRLLLELCGYDLFEAASGAEGLVLAEVHQPSLILLDLGLPDGDGVEFAQEFRRRANTARIPIVIFTGELVHGRRAEILSTICAGIIPKPLAPERLQRDLRLLLALGQRGTLRRFPRYPVEIATWYRLRAGGDPTAAAPLAGVVRVFSEGGLRIDLPNPIPEASVVEIRLPVQTGGVTTTGKVVYSRASRDEKTGGHAFQPGVQFLGLDAGTFAALKGLMKATGGVTS